MIVLTLAGGEFWTFYAILHHRAKDGISAILAEIFLTFAALYWFDAAAAARALTRVIALVAPPPVSPPPPPPIP